MPANGSLDFDIRLLRATASYSGPGSVVGIATGYGLDGDRIPVGARFSAPVQAGPGAHPASCTMGTGSFPGVKSGRGVTLTPHPLLVPWLWNGRAIPLLPLWVVLWPVQSLSACTRVHFTLPLRIQQRRIVRPVFLVKVPPETVPSMFKWLIRIFTTTDVVCVQFTRIHIGKVDSTMNSYLFITVPS
jgi:hypothetical protein